MRILFLVTDYPSESQPASGIFHKTQAEALQKLGVSVDIVAPLPSVPFGLHLVHPRWAGYRAIARRQALCGLQIYRPRYVHWPLRLHVGPGADAAFARATMSVLSAKPDVLHAHFAYPPGLAAARLARRLGVPTVLTLHGSDVNVLPERGRRNAARFRSAVVSADALVAVSTALANRAETLTGRRPDVLPIGIPLKRFGNAPSREEARKSLGLQPESRVVAYVGQVARAKGIREFLESMRRLAADGVEGIVVGDGRERREVEGVASVRCYGAQPNDRIPLFMAAADALVLPSYSEGLPTVLVEAGAVGTPVIATGVGGIPELLGNGRGVLIPVGSVEALVEAIGRVFADPQSAAARAARLKRHVQEAYDADRNATRLLSFYRELLSRSHGLQAERS